MLVHIVMNYVQNARRFHMYNAMKDWTKRGKKALILAFFIFKLQEHLESILFIFISLDTKTCHVVATLH